MPSMVISKGGLREVVGGDERHMCSSKHECATKTWALLRGRPEELDKLRQKWSDFPKTFSVEKFYRRVMDMFAINDLSYINPILRNELGLIPREVASAWPFGSTHNRN